MPRGFTKAFLHEVRILRPSLNATPQNVLSSYAPSTESFFKSLRGKRTMRGLDSELECNPLSETTNPYRPLPELRVKLKNEKTSSVLGSEKQK